VLIGGKLFFELVTLEAANLGVRDDLAA